MSFVVAARSNRFSKRDARAAAENAVREYRVRMAEYAALPTLQVWYASIDNPIALVRDPEMRRHFERELRKAQRRDPVSEFARLTHTVDGAPRIKDDPPLIYHEEARGRPEFWRRMQAALKRYRETLPEDRRRLFDRFQLHDFAVKVVGVGSVGTVCAIALFFAGEYDPLFLQIKEARRSVLEPFAGKSAYNDQGQRVVVGQRLMQAASDIFLGWTRGQMGRHYYIRQLRDMKISPVIEIMKPLNLVRYATVCGWALARAHARSGDASRLAGYIGRRATFDRAVADFAVDYADQNERDHAALVAAVRAGRLEARSDA